MVRWRDILETCAAARGASALGRGGGACRALSDPQSRHRRRQSRACRSGRRTAGHRRHLRGQDRRRRQSRRARCCSQGFFSRPADDRAQCRRDRHRDPLSGVAGASPLSAFANSPAAAAISRWRPPRLFYDEDGGGKARMLMSAPSASPTDRCASLPWRMCSTASKIDDATIAQGGNGGVCGCRSGRRHSRHRRLSQDADRRHGRACVARKHR